MDMQLTYHRTEMSCQPCVKLVLHQMLQQARAVTDYGHHRQLYVNMVSILLQHNMSFFYLNIHSSEYSKALINHKKCRNY